MEFNWNLLRPEEKELLIEPVKERISTMRKAVATNQSFLDSVISVAKDLEQLPPDAEDPATMKDYEMYLDNENSSQNMGKVRSTIKQFAREWSSTRQEEREQAYGPLLEGLRKYVDPTRKDGSKPYVLCPGSGLGRLPFEIACLGYNCQGNEFSFFMLIGSYFILNHSIPIDSLIVHPYVLNTTNRRGHKDHLTPVRIPDVDTTSIADAGVDFSMCAGDFVEVYATKDREWDALVTCFFLDTAHNIVQYILVIAHITKFGGVWLNLGPLLYHFAESFTEMSVELSWEECRFIIAKYFDILEERYVDCYYTSAPKPMLQAQYHCIYFAARRNKVILDPSYMDTTIQLAKRNPKDYPNMLDYEN